MTTEEEEEDFIQRVLEGFPGSKELTEDEYEALGLEEEGDDKTKPEGNEDVQ